MWFETENQSIKIDHITHISVQGKNIKLGLLNGDTVTVEFDSDKKAEKTYRAFIERGY